MPERLQSFLSYGFRPFFLLNGCFAVVAVLLWILTLHGNVPSPVANPAYWHAHEMLVGFAMATIAGFLLTAIANWTGRPPLQGRILGWLVFCWAAGRVAMAFSGIIPAWAVAVVDLVFPLLLFALVTREIAAARNRRNYPVAGIVAVLTVLNLCYHLGAVGLWPGSERAALYLMIHTVLLLITVIGGRVIPNFTANWLRGRGETRLPRMNANVDKVTVLATLCTGIAATFWPSHWVTGVLALAASASHFFRLAGWRGLATGKEPLLLVLHVAYAWLPFGYALTACAAFGWIIAPTAALHALTMGAIGSMVLAMITRVPLGHTGRPLHAGRVTVISYAVLTVAIVVRVSGPLLPAHYLAMIDLSALGWMLAFAIFSLQYWPVLTRPRLS